MSYHDTNLKASVSQFTPFGFDTNFTYTFSNFFHPFVGELISQLNTKSLDGFFDVNWQNNLQWGSITAGDLASAASFDAAWDNSIGADQNPQKYHNYFSDLYNPTEDAQTQSWNDVVDVNYYPKEIDVSIATPYGPYANYNWELFFHIPLMIAVHLSKNQRFQEAQRWFHRIFDPTLNDLNGDPKGCWKFLGFREQNKRTIEDIVRSLSGNNTDKDALDGYTNSLNKPFQPHAIARTRLIAYQYNVVMKYLDNLIGWGDNLFLQDTIETINEASQIYILAANVLGRKPEQIPQTANITPKSFKQLKESGLGPIGDGLVDLESRFPINLTLSSNTNTSQQNKSALFGIGQTLYFCIPSNQKLLGYWDTVADRLFKIRHCMNIEGIVRPLALFDPPIDPGMLVKALAAGIDIGSIVSGLNQPAGPVRSLFYIQKALELCAEVRSLGNALLSAFEKGDAEHLAIMRQNHEIKIQQMTKEVKFLQWKQAQENTTSLITSRDTALEKLHYYERLLGLPSDPNAPAFNIDHSENADDEPKLNQDNFDDAYAAFVGQYDKQLSMQQYAQLMLAGDTSPGILSGFSGSGKIYLSKNEDTELNVHLPIARDTTLVSTTFHSTASTLTPIPDPKVNLHFWGLGGTIDLKVGTVLATVARLAGDIAGITASWERDQAVMASKFASYERRADEWLLQHNLAAHEVMQYGRQILTSLITEQITHHEYKITTTQIELAQEIEDYIDPDSSADKKKFTNEELYTWMQGEASRLYYEYYRFAFDTARKAETAMKQELMRPELDAQDFISYNYWDSGRQGLLSGEALYFDVKKMEMAYHDNNKREIELTKHVSLRQLSPLALLILRATGSCQVDIPEWLYDLDCPGHYMRRIKSVAISIPCVAGPYTSINCTLSLLKSSLRTSSIAGDSSDDYFRQSDDDRFTDFAGAIQSIVTSSAQNDSGMFETNLRDERFLPFEGSGVISSWQLDLANKDYPTFDYDTISDVILHIRYTSRQGLDSTKVKSALTDLFAQPDQTKFALLFSLRHDFPTEWNAFASNKTPTFMATIKKSYFPYFSQGSTITISDMEIYGEDMMHHLVGDVDFDSISGSLNDKTKSSSFNVSIPADVGGPIVMKQEAGANTFLLIKYVLN
jgi:hypothetical protein